MLDLNLIVYVNGEYKNSKDAVVSVFDRGFVFGDGIYEVVPVVNKKLVDKRHFWERFKRSMRETRLKLNFNDSQFEDILYNLIEKNNVQEGGVYIQITRGVANREFKFLDLEPTIVAYAYSKNIFENEYASTGISVVTSEDIRWKRRDIKSISLLAQCFAKDVAARVGAYECIMLENGHVTEGSSSSVFIIKDNRLITKALSNDILPGIRRQVILGFASDLGLKVETRDFTLDELYNCDEAFISAATLITLPITKVDDKLINNGKIGKFEPLIRDKYSLLLKKEAGLI